MLVDTKSYTVPAGKVYEIGLALRDAGGKTYPAEQMQELRKSGQLTIEDSCTGSITEMMSSEWQRANRRKTGRRSLYPISV